jgi:hypothetical protein
MLRTISHKSAVALPRQQLFNPEFGGVDDSKTASKKLLCRGETCMMLSTPRRRNTMDAERPPKRIITESRKEQNRIAAKAYRKRESPISQTGKN